LVGFSRLVVGFVRVVKSLFPGGKSKRPRLMIRNMKKLPKFRGVSLLEAILALSVGGIVITGSAFGIAEYTTGVKIQATAGMLERLTKATDRYAEDNYEDLLANAPQELPIEVVAPYYASNIRQDAFRNNYVLTTRRYPITVPDPRNPGNTITEDALQVLVVGMKAPNSDLDDDVVLRAEIANTSGAASGFVSRDDLTCSNAANNATRPDGHICGAFGSYSFSPATFPATNFDDAAVVGLVTKGDSSVYGDQLYRYDYGDPELNTMHTDIHMQDNNLLDPDEIDGVNAIRMDGPANIITAETSSLTLQSEFGGVTLNPSDNTITLQENGPGRNPVRVTASTRLLNLDNDEVTIGDKVPETHGAATQEVGSGNLYSDVARSNEIRTGEVNSKFLQNTDALRLQKFAGGEVIVGNRVRYSPAGASSVYEISDGQIMAQHLSIQDITCADCGGTLSEILPKWRHMGTYFIPRNNTWIYIRKPACINNRRGEKIRGAIGDDQMYWDGSQDRRYVPRVVVTPRYMGSQTVREENTVFGWDFRAENSGPNQWRVMVRTQAAVGSALAATYCVFTGGNPDPNSTTVPAMQGPSTPSSPVWSKIE
jgi:hypothetical protein